MTTSNFLAYFSQILMNICNNVFRGFSWKNLVQDVSAGITLRRTPNAYLNTTYCETCLESAQYSRRFMSRPLTSVLVLVPSSTLIAAYFFFWSRRSRWKIPSRSISSSLYRSLTLFLNIADIFKASARSVTFELTKTESVSPYTTYKISRKFKAIIERNSLHQDSSFPPTPSYASRFHGPWRWWGQQEVLHRILSTRTQDSRTYCWRWVSRLAAWYHTNERVVNQIILMNSGCRAHLQSLSCRGRPIFH